MASLPGVYLQRVTGSLLNDRVRSRDIGFKQHFEELVGMYQGAQYAIVDFGQED